MKSYVALFRGINVGGNNLIKMKALVAILQELGLQNIQTYIQSGNVVFESDEGDTAVLAAQMSQAVDQAQGFRSAVTILSGTTLQSIADTSPFAECESKSVHYYFLSTKPVQADLDILQALALDSEEFELGGDAFYLHAPEGIGRSRLAAKVEKAMGVAVTARNGRTVKKLLAMLSFS